MDRRDQCTEPSEAASKCRKNRWRNLSWRDGYNIPTNGAMAGNADPPYAETTIIHGGDQSIPLFYDNTGAATYSEAERTFAVAQNWTEAGVQTLVLYFHGA